ncbi:MAG: MBL fold metallo-hydrolase [Acidobacteriota bacterium]
MKLHQLRNATMIIESGDHHILVDPMLGVRKSMGSYTSKRHPPKRNPLVSLPANADALLEKVTHGLITHSQKWGIESLRHGDHLDGPGEAFLRERKTPVITGAKDAPHLRKKMGINVVDALLPWTPRPFLGGQITAVPATHGRGWVRHLMANGVGFHIELPDEPSLYISGDTVFSTDVQRAFTELRPDFAVMAAGSASLDFGGPILMPMDELVAFTRAAPGQVIANHLEALNHCPTTRAGLREELEKHGLSALIPEDGETLEFN